MKQKQKAIISIFGLWIFMAVYVSKATNGETSWYNGFMLITALVAALITYWAIKEPKGDTKED